jgi:hypothetical protein
VERRERCRGLLWDVELGALRCGADVFLEFGLLPREAFYERARAQDVALAVYVLDAPRSVRRPWLRASLGLPTRRRRS